MKQTTNLNMQKGESQFAIKKKVAEEIKEQLNLNVSSKNIRKIPNSGSDKKLKCMLWVARWDDFVIFVYDYGNSDLKCIKAKFGQY